MKSIRAMFSILRKQPLVYLDSAATSLKPYIVIKAINNYYQNFSVNSHSNTSNPLFSKVINTNKETKELIAQKIKAKSEEISFVPSATYAFNILALSLKKHLKKGDKICLTYLEHSSNIYPWQA